MQEKFQISKKIVIYGLSTYFLKLNKNILSAYYFSVTLQP